MLDKLGIKFLYGRLPPGDNWDIVISLALYNDTEREQICKWMNVSNIPYELVTFTHDTCIYVKERDFVMIKLKWA